MVGLMVELDVSQRFVSVEDLGHWSSWMDMILLSK